MLLSLILLACIWIPIGIWVASVLTQTWGSHKRIKRMAELQRIVCSTEYTVDQRRAAMDELMSMSLRYK